MANANGRKGADGVVRGFGESFIHYSIPELNLTSTLQRGIHYTFEDTRSSKDNGDPSRTTPEEWIESIERAKELAISQNMMGSYNSDTGFDMSSSVSSPTSTLGGGVASIYPEGFSVADRSGRKNISKSQASLQEDSTKRHRFSKRQSKNGLAAVF
jgi:3-phosphoinositide dependent protein kinase-1